MVRSVLESTQTIEELNAIVGDPNCERQLRCKAVLSLFVNYVPPLVSINEIPKILTNQSWLDHSNVYRCPGIFGWTFHNFQLGDMFTIFLYPEDGFVEGPYYRWKANQGWSDYSLTLVFDGHFSFDDSIISNNPYDVDACIQLWDVFSGAQSADMRLMEFSFQLPNGWQELYTRDGITIHDYFCR